MQKGHKHSKSTKDKMRLLALSRDNTNRIASLPKGKAHWRWSNIPSKAAIHRRIHRSKGKASQFPCYDCGKPARDWSSQTGKYDKNDEFVPRCRSCHIKKDQNWIRKRPF